MIGTEPRGQTLPGDGLLEQAAECWTVDGHGLHAKADDPAGKLIQDDQHTKDVCCSHKISLQSATNLQGRRGRQDGL